MTILDLVAINSDASLNTFFKTGVIRFVPGQAFDMLFMLSQPDKGGIRYMTASGATASMTLKNSDDTDLVLTGSFPFAADSSIVKFSVTDVQSANLVGQNLIAIITEGAVVNSAFLSGGLQAVLLVC